MRPCLRFAVFLLLTVGFPLPLPAVDPPPALRWFPSVDEGRSWETAFPPPTSETSPLLYRPDFPSVGPLRIDLLGGEPFDLAASRGRVVLLDFWASWCSPCLHELPHLQALWERKRQAGFDAVAVNAEEPDALARTTAKQLGLTLPIGRYDEVLEERFRVRTLPTVVLLDREGRLRGRWDGYREGLEKAISERVDALLGADREAAPTEIARTDPGGLHAEVVWSAEFTEPVGGVAFFRKADGAPGIAVSTGDSLALLDATGRTVRRLGVPSDVFRIEAASPGPNREARLLAWREGGERVVEIRPESEQVRAVLAPGVIWDVVEFAPAGQETAGLAWATPAGVFLSASDGSTPRRIGEAFPARRLLTMSRASGTSFLVLDAEGVVRSVTEGSTSAPSRAALHRATGVVRGAGFGLFGPPVVDAVDAVLTGSAVRMVAMAAAPNRLAVVQASDGRSVWSATWDGVIDLQIGDLDGDGADELLVASGRRVTALRFGPR